MPMSRSLYEVIGVRPMATQEEIRRAYVEHAMEYTDNPPQTEFGELLFKKVTHAYEILGDPEKRREYDELRNSEESSQMRPVADTSQASKANASFKYAIWLIAAVLVVLVYSNITSPTPKVDLYKVHIGAQQSSRAEIEKEELRRDRLGEAPLSKDEIGTISDRHVLNEIRKGNQ